MEKSSPLRMVTLSDSQCCSATAAHHPLPCRRVRGPRVIGRLPRSRNGVLHKHGHSLTIACLSHPVIDCCFSHSVSRSPLYSLLSLAVTFHPRCRVPLACPV